MRYSVSVTDHEPPCALMLLGIFDTKEEAEQYIVDNKLRKKYKYVFIWEKQPLQ